MKKLVIGVMTVLLVITFNLIIFIVLTRSGNEYHQSNNDVFTLTNHRDTNLFSSSSSNDDDNSYAGLFSSQDEVNQSSVDLFNQPASFNDSHYQVSKQTSYLPLVVMCCFTMAIMTYLGSQIYLRRKRSDEDLNHDYISS